MGAEEVPLTGWRKVAPSLMAAFSGPSQGSLLGLIITREMKGCPEQYNSGSDQRS